MAGNTRSTLRLDKELDHLINRRREIASPTTSRPDQLGGYPRGNAVDDRLRQPAPRDRVHAGCAGRCRVRGARRVRWWTLIATCRSCTKRRFVPGRLDHAGRDRRRHRSGGRGGFFSFVRLERELPKFEDIVRSPDKIKIPVKADGQMLSVYNLAHRVCEKTLDAVIVYIDRMGKEFAVTFAKSACQRDAKLVIHPSMRKWSSQNASLMAALNA